MDIFQEAICCTATIYRLKTPCNFAFSLSKYILDKIMESFLEEKYDFANHYS